MAGDTDLLGTAGDTGTAGTQYLSRQLLGMHAFLPKTRCVSLPGSHHMGENFGGHSISGDTVFTEAIRRSAFIPVFTRRVSPLWTCRSICIAADQNHPWNLLISSKMLCPGGPRQTQQERASGMPARAGDQEH